MINHWEVTVSNIGRVYDGEDYEDARSTFNLYVEQSQSDAGRACGENVYLFRDGELFANYEGGDQDNGTHA